MQVLTKIKYYCYFNTRAICTVHVVISVDSFNITISVSAKFLEPAMFWHMNGEANKNMDASQQIYTFFQLKKMFLYVCIIVEQSFELNIYFFVSVDIFAMFHYCKTRAWSIKYFCQVSKSTLIFNAHTL